MLWGSLCSENNPSTPPYMNRWMISCGWISWRSSSRSTPIRWISWTRNLRNKKIKNRILGKGHLYLRKNRHKNKNKTHTRMVSSLRRLMCSAHFVPRRLQISLYHCWRRKLNCRVVRTIFIGTLSTGSYWLGWCRGYVLANSSSRRSSTKSSQSTWLSWRMISSRFCSWMFWTWRAHSHNNPRRTSLK